MPSLLAQINLPYEQMLRTELSVLIAVMLIVLLLVLGGLGFMVLRLMNRITDRTDKNAEAAASAQKAADTAQVALTNAGAALNTTLGANTDELRKQTTVLNEHLTITRQVLQLVSALPAQVDAVGAKTTADLRAQIDTSNTELKAGITRIESSLASLRDEISAGGRAHRAEMLGKLDAILSEIASLKPPPPPHLVKPLEPLERKEGAA
jgi:Trk-type K+ transport system membrane component